MQRALDALRPHSRGSTECLVSHEVAHELEPRCGGLEPLCGGTIYSLVLEPNAHGAG